MEVCDVLFQQLHALIADHIDGGPDQVSLTIETDRGPW
jgi:hypothetical protein